MLPLALGALALGGVLPVGAELPAPVQSLLQRYRIPDGTLGVYVHDVARREPLVAHNVGTPFNPASAMKLVTTFVALDRLGPTYTWPTEAYVDGRVHEGRLEGDLLLKGYGDPFLVTEHFWKLVRGLRLRGLRHIEGDVLVDDSYFELPPPAPGAFDGRPYRTYNAVPNALMLNYQAIRFLFFPEPHAGRVRIVADPPATTLEIENRLELTGGACGGRKYRIRMAVQEDGAGDARTVRFWGPYPASCGRHQLIRSVTFGPPFVLGAFEAMWQRMGGSVGGGLGRGVVPEGRRPYLRIESPALPEVVRGMNKYSNNVMTRQLFLALGAEAYGPPGTPEKARAAVSAGLEALGLDFPELVIDNGAGLSRDARISAESLGRLLLAAHAHPYMPEFAASLPIAALEGTMRRRFRDEPLAGRVRAKTGQLDDVKAMAGYVLSESGRTFAVVSLHNHPGIHWGRGREVQDALLRWVFRQ